MEGRYEIKSEEMKSSLQKLSDDLALPELTITSFIGVRDEPDTDDSPLKIFKEPVMLRISVDGRNMTFEEKAGALDLFANHLSSFPLWVHVQRVRRNYVRKEDQNDMDQQE